MNEPLKQTPLHARHLELGAKMMPFAGYDMPVRYAGDRLEHEAVRKAAGLFDVSHMGEFLLRGPGALPLLQKLTTNDVSKIEVGRAQYNCLPNEQGGIIDDLIVYRLEEQLYMAVVNASNRHKDWAWITQHATEDVQLEDISDQTVLIALAGPRALDILNTLTEAPVSSLPFYAQLKATVAGIDQVLVATTGYTGERSFELYVRAEHGVALWDALMAAGKPFGLQPAGLGARDTLRLEMGYMLHGNDISPETTPYEAGLGWIVKPAKGPFTASELLVAQKAQGPARKLVGFVLEDKGICRAGYEVALDGEAVGTITSGGYSPTLGLSIGMAYVPAQVAQHAHALDVLVRGSALRARIVKMPFVKDTSLSRWQATLSS